MATNNSFDIIIAGGGIAGAFAAYRLSKLTRNIKIGLIEFGRPPGKRRKQLEGWFGCFPTSNSRLYQNDITKVEALTGHHCDKVFDKLNHILADFGSTKFISSKKPSVTAKQRASKLGYTYNQYDYIQWKPENVHLLSRFIAEEIEKNPSIQLIFDNGINAVTKKNKKFVLETEQGIFESDKLILALGRSGWRIAKSIFDGFSMIENDDYAYYGFTAEIPSVYMKEWSGSHCSFERDNMTIGPLCWKGTVIPEDHVDLVISSWRSNEERWNSEKVSFSVTRKDEFPAEGSKQTERLGKLAFVLSDSRVGRIRASEYFNNNLEISLVPEYHWLKDEIEALNELFPSYLSKGAMYFPHIELVPPVINIKSDLSTKIDGLYVAGESAGVKGILSACLTGYIVGESVVK